MQRLIILLSILCCCFVTSPIYAALSYNYQIKGISNELLKNVKIRLDEDKDDRSQTTALTAQKIHQRYQKAPALILKALQPYGYFKAVVQSHLLKQNNNWQAIFVIVLGEPLRITHLQVSVIGAGQNNKKIQKLLKDFPLQAGQILTMPAYNAAKQALFDSADSQGYIAAQLIQHEIHIDLKSYTATVILQLDTGPIFYFGDVKFLPNPFEENFLQRFMPFKVGEPYSTKKILTLQDNLVNSNYFSEVSVEAKRNQTKNNYIPTEINVVPRRPHQYTLGIGYGTDTGPRGTLGWDWRRVTATGQRFSTLLQLSQIQNSFQAIYTIPGKNPVTDQYNIAASVLSNDIEQGKSFTQQLGLADVHAFGNWKRTLSLNYQFEQFQFTDQSKRYSNLLIPSVNWTYLKADNQIYPTHGQQFTVIVKGAQNALLSTTSFIQTEIKDKYITSPTQNSRLILRADVGYTAVKDIQKFPLSQFFYAGGAQNIRGYRFQSLGPGRYLAVGSGEFQHKIIGNWSAAVFYDVGNAVNHIDGRVMQAAGVGIVWKSPLGPMELTVAKALNKPGRPNQIQFSMGPELG